MVRNELDELRGRMNKGDIYGERLRTLVTPQGEPSASAAEGFERGSGEWTAALELGIYPEEWDHSAGPRDQDQRLCEGDGPRQSGLVDEKTPVVIGTATGTLRSSPEQLCLLFDAFGSSLSACRRRPTTSGVPVAVLGGQWIDKGTLCLRPSVLPLALRAQMRMH